MTTSYSTTSNTGTIWVRVEVAPREPPMDPRLVEAIYEACAWLELEPPLNGHEAIRTQRKRLALTHHPDRGGDAETMKQVNAAADFLLGLR